MHCATEIHKSFCLPFWRRFCLTGMSLNAPNVSSYQKVKLNNQESIFFQVWTLQRFKETVFLNFPQNLSVGGSTVLITFIYCMFIFLFIILQTNYWSTDITGTCIHIWLFDQSNSLLATSKRMFTRTGKAFHLYTLRKWQRDSRIIQTERYIILRCTQRVLYVD